MEHKKSIRVRINPWDRQRMVKYLEAQAQKGWMFCGFDEKKWKFRLIEPKKVHFSVVYFPADFEKDETAVPRLLEFREFCAHDGWELAGAYEEMQVFYSLKEDPTPIDTDPKIEIESMHTVALRKLKPELKKYGMHTAFNLLLALFAYHANPVMFFLHPMFFIWLTGYGGSLAVSVLRCGEEHLWLYRAKRYASRYDEYPHDLKHIRVSTPVAILVALMVAEMMVRHLGLAVFLSLVLCVLLVVMVIVLVLRWLDRQYFGDRWTTVIGVALLLAVVTISMGIYTGAAKVLHLDMNRYAPMGSHWARYEEAPPLSAEEFYGEGLENLRYYSWVEETPFLAKYVAHMDAAREEDWVELDYEIMEVKWNALYDLCVEEYVHGIMKGSCVYVDASPWGAKTACFRGSEATPTNLWLLCYEDRIVLLYISEDPTPGQMALIGQVLGNEQNFEN